MGLHSSSHNSCCWGWWVQSNKWIKCTRHYLFALFGFPNRAVPAGLCSSCLFGFTRRSSAYTTRPASTRLDALHCRSVRNIDVAGGMRRTSRWYAHWFVARESTWWVSVIDFYKEPFGPQIARLWEPESLRPNPSPCLSTKAHVQVCVFWCLRMNTYIHRRKISMHICSPWLPHSIRPDMQHACISRWLVLEEMRDERGNTTKDSRANKTVEPQLRRHALMLYPTKTVDQTLHGHECPAYQWPDTVRRQSIGHVGCQLWPNADKKCQAL